MWNILRMQTFCLLCHAAAAQPICAGCRNDVRRLYPDAAQLCPLCAADSVQAAVCGHCQQHPPPYQALWASADYRAPLPSLLHHWKHLRQSALLPLFTHILLDNPPPWLPESGIDAVLAMPLSRQRRLWRGFNQCDELAHAVTTHYNLPLLPHHTVQRRHKPPQSTLPAAERARNVRQVFQAATTVKNRKILIIEDVVTSGATIRELSQSLLLSGAAAVWVWVVARNRSKNI